MTGIYLLYYNDEVVYVGKSVNLGRRIKNHKQDKSKIFDSYRYIVCNQELLESTEELYILKYNPLYNVKRIQLYTTGYKNARQWFSNNIFGVKHSSSRGQEILNKYFYV